MPGLLDFLQTPSGVGLLSAVAGGMAGARRGTPFNNAGRGLVAGLTGYTTAQDQLKQDAENKLTQQYKQLQMDQLQQQIATQKAQQAWRAGLADKLTPRPAIPESYNVGTQSFPTQEAAQAAYGALDNVGGYPSVAPGQTSPLMQKTNPLQQSPLMPGITGQESPLTTIPSYAPMQHTEAQAGGIDTQALQQYLMQPGSPVADKIIENKLIPKDPKYQAVGDTLLKIGGDGTVNPVYSGPKKAPEGMQYDASGNLVEIPGYVTMKSKIAAAGRAPSQPAQPYYSPVQTANGVMAFNARTGRMEPVMVNGQAVVGSQSDPTLQGGIARAKTAGKSMGEAQGTLAAAQGAMPQIEDTVKKLKQIGKDATYTYAGQARDAIARQFGVATPGAVAREKYIQTVRDVLFPQLRTTFGAQFTVKEGEALVATLGDPNKTPAERNAALDSFLEQKKMHIQSLQRQTGQHAAPSGSETTPALPDGWSVQEHQ